MITNLLWLFSKEYVRNCLFQTFFYTKDVVWETSIFFQNSYSNTKLSITYCIHGHARNVLQKEHLNSSLHSLKITVLIPWRNVLTNLVTFKFGVHTFDVISRKSRMSKSYIITQKNKSTSKRLYCQYIFTK